MVPDAGVTEYGNVAYQINGNEAYNNMLVNDFALTPLTPGWD